ncbi:hypothetical protein ACFL7E_00745 [Thermodesulfobacteriota bacterium]
MKNLFWFWQKGKTKLKPKSYIKLSDLDQKTICFDESRRLKINSSPKASPSNTGTALFNPRSKVLRLRIEMPCSRVAQAREKSGIEQCGNKQIQQLMGGNASGIIWRQPTNM